MKIILFTIGFMMGWRLMNWIRKNKKIKFIEQKIIHIDLLGEDIELDYPLTFTHDIDSVTTRNYELTGQWIL